MLPLKTDTIVPSLSIKQSKVEKKLSRIRISIKTSRIWKPDSLQCAKLRMIRSYLDAKYCPTHASFEKQLGEKPNLEVGFGPSTSLKAGLVAASLPLVLFSFELLLATDSADFFGSLTQREREEYVKIRYQIHLPAIFFLQKEWNTN